MTTDEQRLSHGRIFASSYSRSFSDEVPLEVSTSFSLEALVDLASRSNFSVTEGIISLRIGSDWTWGSVNVPGNVICQYMVGRVGIFCGYNGVHWRD